jgi:hypothetical protein
VVVQQPLEAMMQWPVIGTDCCTTTAGAVRPVPAPDRLHHTHHRLCDADQHEWHSKSDDTGFVWNSRTPGTRWCPFEIAAR